MGTVLKIVGIVAIVVVVAGLLALIWLVWKAKSIAKSMAAPPVPPCRIHPEPETNPQWRNPEVVPRYAEELRALGFQDAGTFSIPELGGLQIWGFTHPRERYLAVVYDHANIAPTFDICCDFEDGGELNGTNTKLGGTLDTRPGVTTLRLDGADVKEVFQAVQQHPQVSPRLPVRPESFAEHFEASYAKGMNWRLKKGGATRDEIRRQAEQDGQQVNDEQLEDVYGELRAAYVTELQSGCVAQYLDDTKPSPAEWERIQDRVIAIPETLEAKEVLESLEGLLCLDEEQSHRLAALEIAFGDTALDLMERILQEDIASLGLTKLGEVAEPVRAFILISPEQEDETA